MSDRRSSLGLALALITTAVLLRLLPHPANFAPVTAVSIFGGAVLPRKLAVWIPVAVMMTDLIIGFYGIMPIVWACYVLIALASSQYLRHPSAVKGTGLVLASSLFFFIVTNFAVWLFDGMYPHTLGGLADCYAMAVPFFKNTALSDLFYSGLLFGLFAISIRLVDRCAGLLNWRMVR